MANKSDLTVDGDLVRSLATLLLETGLSEIEYAVGDRRIRVVRNAPAAPSLTVAMPAVPAATPGPAAEPAGAIKSPMVGTAYLAPEPGAPPFVNPGESVREGQVLLIIEAMKVMNQIHAPRSGKVTQILISDSAPVEFGQVLMVLE